MISCMNYRRLNQVCMFDPRQFHKTAFYAYGQYQFLKMLFRVVKLHS